MERASWHAGLRVVSLMLLVVFGLGSSGCLLATAGAVGGAVTYAYCKGKHSQIYAADFVDTTAAVQAALADFGMPVLKAELGSKKGKIESRTADGEKVKIYLEALPSPIPTDGLVTRVSIRVATFGDQFVSQRFFDQVGAHLIPASVLLPGPATPPDQPPLDRPVISAEQETQGASPRSGP